jgi:hypothetical protein
MAESNAPATKAPWHLWVVGVLSLLWNAMGAMDFTMTQMRSEAWLKAFTPAQLEYIYGFPLWAVISWGVATWGSFIGSVLLLARRKLAVPVNLVVLVGIVPTFAYNHILTDGVKIMGGGIGHVIFSAVIIVIAVLLFIYSRTMARRGVLR